MKNFNYVILVVIAVVVILFETFHTGTTEPAPFEPAGYTTTTESVGQTDSVVTKPVDTPAQLSGTSSLLFILINQVRETPLVYKSILADLAQQRAEYLCTHIFSHDGYKMFVSQADYSYAGENLARGFNNPRDMFDAFMASPTHKSNILGTQYQAIGIGNACGITVVFFGGRSN